MRYWSALSLIIVISLPAEGQLRNDTVLTQEIYDTGLSGLSQTLFGNIKYPSAERRNEVGGTVSLMFVVRPDMSVDSVTVINPVTPAIDAEATRVLKLTSGHWTTNGRGVFLVPIQFSQLHDQDEHRNYAVKYLKEGNYRKAVKHLVELKRLNPLDMDSLDNLIEAYRVLGETENEMKTRQFKELILEFKGSGRIVFVS